MGTSQVDHGKVAPYKTLAKLPRSQPEILLL